MNGNLNAQPGQIVGLSQSLAARASVTAERLQPLLDALRGVRQLPGPPANNRNEPRPDRGAVGNLVDATESLDVANKLIGEIEEIIGK